jgi:uroporphyrinogen-III decarboxylase
MQETMSGKERILAAMSGQMPDRVPVQLGITNMFSVYQQGLIGWDVYAYQNQPLWRVVADTQRRFGLDGYLYLRPAVKTRPGDPRRESTLTQLDADKLERRTVIHTPEGDLTSAETIMKNESPTVTEGLIKSERDFHLWLKYGLPDDTDYDLASIREPIAYMGQNGTCAGSASIPGLHALTDVFEGRLAAATYFITDYPDCLELYREKAERHLLRAVEQVIDAGVDYIELSGSGMLTLSTPGLFRHLCLPFIRKAAAICSQAGILVEVHCCGKARLVVEALYRETAVNSVNPLQPPPMGDCDLAKIKRDFGDRLCLKGNVGVTHPLLFGTPDDVERDVLRCLEAAKAGGRFILFSEEGIGAQTPAENVMRYVSAAKAYGAY